MTIGSKAVVTMGSKVVVVTMGSKAVVVTEVRHL